MSIVLFCRLATPWRPSKLVLSGPRETKTCILTNSVGTWSHYTPSREPPFPLWSSFARSSRVSDVHSTLVPLRFGDSVSCMRTLPIAISDASTNTWKLFVQSGGCTIGACDNITFNAWYAFSSYSAHWKGKWCTIACSGVAKSAKCHTIMLCHQICPKNWLRAFVLFGAGASRISLTLSGSTDVVKIR